MAAPRMPAGARPRVLAAIVHVTSAEEHDRRDAAGPKVARLLATLDGLLSSLAHCELVVLVVTMRGRNVVPFLPEYLRRTVDVLEVEGGDPMFIGFRAQDALVARRADHDWFIFLEDDIEIRDSAFLDKVSRFAAQPGNERCVLLPNRFEYHEGVKRYIDLTHCASVVSWNRHSIVEQDGAKLAECSNPHAGMFCLSRAQVDLLVASGRDWRGQDLFGGPRESAATFSLMECFTLYKPHPDNFHYLEVRHVDTKYSELHADVQEYTYSSASRRETA